MGLLIAALVLQGPGVMLTSLLRVVCVSVRWRQHDGTEWNKELCHPITGQCSVPDQYFSQQHSESSRCSNRSAASHGIFHQPHWSGELGPRPYSFIYFLSVQSFSRVACDGRWADQPASFAKCLQHFHVVKTQNLKLFLRLRKWRCTKRRFLGEKSVSSLLSNQSHAARRFCPWRRHLLPPSRPHPTLGDQSATSSWTAWVMAWRFLYPHLFIWTTVFEPFSPC